MEEVINYVSVIIPCRNEESFIGNVLDDIIKQDYPLDYLEVLVIDGMSTDMTANIVLKYQKEHTSIRLIENPEKIVPTALNRGIKDSKGSVIVRLDAHCRYPSNYLSYLVSNLIKLNAGNVGVAVVSKPKSDKIKSIAIAACMASPFGIGNSAFRTGVKTVQKTDTVPFGCFKKAVFDEIGLFDTELIRNQDDEFNARMIKNGFDIYILPDLSITYYTRETIAQTANMFYYYGYFKPLVNKKVGSPATMRQFAPPLFVLANITAIIAIFIHFTLGAILFSAIWIPYAILCFYFSAKICSMEKNIKLFFLLVAVFVSIHFTYGFGYIRGLIRFQIRGKSSGFKDITVKR